MSDIRLTYPVWLVKPNWRDDVGERLDFLTDVMNSERDVEQRRQTRTTPRRSFEASFLRANRDRQLLELSIIGIGQQMALVPLWHDETRINVTLEAGVSEIPGSFAFREFEPATLAIIRRDDAFDYELVVISGGTDSTLVLVDPLQVKTPAGSTIAPVRVMQVRDPVNTTDLTSDVTQLRMRFHQLEPYDVPGSFGGPVYGETQLPVVELKPNWSQGYTNTIERTVFTLDNSVGNPAVTDLTGQTRYNVRAVYHMNSRERDAAVRQMLFAMGGRLKAFHLPDWKNQLELVRNIVSSDGAIVVERNGYTQFGLANNSVRKYIRLEKVNGEIYYNTIISSNIIDGDEWLYLAESIGDHLMSDVALICFMPIARMDADGIDITRKTDSVSTTTLAFKVFDNDY